MPQSERSVAANDARRVDVCGEIERRARALQIQHQYLDLELGAFWVGMKSGLNTREDYEALDAYVKRRKEADLRIHNGYLDPKHPYWGYKCAGYGTETFNRRVVCPKPMFLGFREAFSGCFCTKQKTHMLDVYSKPEELAEMVSQARRIGHPYELLFIMEGQEDAVKAVKDTLAIKSPRIILWMNPMIDEPAAEARKDAARRSLDINALDSQDMGALFFPPTPAKVGVDLAGSLTGLDMWVDLAYQGHLVGIQYGQEMYAPPYRLTKLK